MHKVILLLSYFWSQCTIVGWLHGIKRRCIIIQHIQSGSRRTGTHGHSRSACMVSTVPPLPLPPFSCLVGFSSFLFYGTQVIRSTKHDRQGNFNCLHYASLFFLSLDFLGGRQGSWTALNHRPLWIKSGGTMSSGRCWKCKMTPPSGCCSFQTHWRMHLGFPLCACVRALAVCVSWERGRAGGEVASVWQRRQRERLSGFSR